MKRKKREIKACHTNASQNIPIKPRDRACKNQIRITCYLAALIAFVAFTIYLPTLWNGFVSWDDDIYVYENLHIRILNLAFFKWAFTDLSTAGLWQPLVWISYGIDHAIWGSNPTGYHLTAIVLHAINTFLVVFLVAKVLSFEKEAREESATGFALNRRSVLIASGVTGILFGLHPLHVESVAWITERKDLLYTCFYFLSVNWYLNYVSDIQSKEANYTRLLGNRNYILSLTFFVLALCSKSMAVSLPIVLMILEWYPLRRITSRESFFVAFIEKTPHFVCSLLVSIVTVIAQKSAGAMKLTEDIPIFDRVLVAIRALIMYLLKIIAPHDLLPFYPYPKLVSLLSPEFLSTILLTFVISAFCVFARKQRLWLSLWGFYVVTLLPVLGFIQAGLQSMADRFTYVASISPFILSGLGVAWSWNWACASRKWGSKLKLIMVSMGFFLCISLTYATVNQIVIWKDSLTFWSYLLGKEPVRFLDAYLNRGMAYWEKNQLDLAIEDFSTAINLNPKFGPAYLNRGMAFIQKGDLDRAEKDYSSAIISKSDYTDAYNNRGSLYNSQGKFDLAIKDLSKAISLDSSYFPAYVNRGIAYGGNGDLNRAVEDYNMAISLKPDAANTYLGRGDLYVRTSKTDLAVKDYKQACDLGSEEACNKVRFSIPIAPTPPKTVPQKTISRKPVSNVPNMNFKEIDEMINKMSIQPAEPSPE